MFAFVVSYKSLTFVYHVSPIIRPFSWYIPKSIKRFFISNIMNFKIYLSTLFITFNIKKLCMEKDPII